MTDEQIIEIAKQLGFERMRIDHDYYVCFSKEIVEFAKLVAQHEREECARIAENSVLYWEKAGYPDGIQAREAMEIAKQIRER